MFLPLMVKLLKTGKICDEIVQSHEPDVETLFTLNSHHIISLQWVPYFHKVSQFTRSWNFEDAKITYSLFGRRNLEGKERKWKKIYYFPMFGSLKKIKWKEMAGIGRKDSSIKFHFPFLPKAGEFLRKEKIYTKYGKLRFFFPFFSILFLSLPFLSFTKNEPNTLLMFPHQYTKFT